METKKCNDLSQTGNKWVMQNCSYSLNSDLNGDYIEFSVSPEQLPEAISKLSLMQLALYASGEGMMYHISISDIGNKLVITAEEMHRPYLLAMMSLFGFDNKIQLIPYPDLMEQGSYNPPNEKVLQVAQEILPSLQPFDPDKANYYTATDWATGKNIIEFSIESVQIPSALFYLSEQKRAFSEQGIKEFKNLGIHLKNGKIVLTDITNIEPELIMVTLGNCLSQMGFNPVSRLIVSLSPIGAMMSDTNLILPPPPVPFFNTETSTLKKRKHGESENSEKEKQPATTKRSKRKEKDIEKEKEKGIDEEKAKKKRKAENKVDWKNTRCELDVVNHQFTITNPDFHPTVTSYIIKRLPNIFRELEISPTVKRDITNKDKFFIILSLQEFNNLQKRNEGVDLREKMEKECQSLQGRRYSDHLTRSAELYPYEIYQNGHQQLGFIRFPVKEITQINTSLKNRINRVLNLAEYIGTALGRTEVMIFVKKPLPEGTLLDVMKKLGFKEPQEILDSSKAKSKLLELNQGKKIKSNIRLSLMLDVQFVRGNQVEITSDLIPFDSLQSQFKSAYNKTLDAESKKKPLPFKFIKAEGKLYCLFKKDNATAEHKELLSRMGIGIIRDESLRNLPQQSSTKVLQSSPFRFFGANSGPVNQGLRPTIPTRESEEASDIFGPSQS